MMIVTTTKPTLVGIQMVLESRCSSLCLVFHRMTHYYTDPDSGHLRGIPGPISSITLFVTAMPCRLQNPKEDVPSKHSPMLSLFHLQDGRKISRGDLEEAFLRLRKNASLNFIELDHTHLHQKNKCSGMTFKEKRTKDLI